MKINKGLAVKVFFGILTALSSWGGWELYKDTTATSALTAEVQKIDLRQNLIEKQVTKNSERVSDNEKELTKQYTLVEIIKSELRNRHK